MKTLKVANGDIVISESQGQPTYVEGLEKAGQDVAGEILTSFSADWQEGNEVLTAGIGKVSANNEAQVEQYLSEAINRLIVRSNVAQLDEKVVDIRQVKTRTIGLTTIVFFAEVEYSSGQLISVVDQFNIQPTELNHLLSPDTMVAI